jgi:hypothetical protein
MIHRTKVLTSVAACLIMLPAFSTGFAAGADKVAVVSDGTRAYDAVQVQNVMSAHEFYHAAGLNLEEVDALWVSPTGAYAKTACFFSPAWVMQGVATVRKAYGEGHQSDKIKAFKELQQAYPELANVDVKEGAYIGGEFAMHTSTTGIVEVALDGKTAKGIWYSPGAGLVPHVNGKSVEVGGIFFWEKYAADFVKEDGKWKIWHMGMYYDFTPQFPASMTERLGNGVKSEAAAGGPGGGPGGGAPPNADANKEKGEKMTAEEIAKGGMLPNPYKYPSWSPTRKNFIVPKIPEPYKTFSETFSYGPYDDNNQMKFIKQ